MTEELDKLEALHQSSKLSCGSYDYQCGYLDCLAEAKELLAAQRQATANSVPVERYKAADTYDALKKQFAAMQTMLQSKERVLSYYMEKDYSLSEKRLSDLSAALESERAMNAHLTAELDHLDAQRQVPADRAAVLDAVSSVLAWAEVGVQSAPRGKTIPDLNWCGKTICAALTNSVPVGAMNKIELALLDSRAVFAILKHDKPDDHPYNLLFENCDKALRELEPWVKGVE